MLEKPFRPSPLPNLSPTQNDPEMVARHALDEWSDEESSDEPDEPTEPPGEEDPAGRYRWECRHAEDPVPAYDIVADALVLAKVSCTLVLKDCGLGSRELAPAFASLAVAVPCLRRLELSGCDLPEASTAEALGRLIAREPRLQELVLRACDLDEAFAERLTSTQSELSCEPLGVSLVDLSGNPGLGQTAALGSLLKALGPLKDVRLDSIRLDTGKGITSLIRSGVLKSVVRLSASGNESLGAGGLRLLVGATDVTVLAHLRLARCGDLASEVERLFEALRPLLSSTSALETLELSGTQLSRLMEPLGSLLTSLPRLQSLSLGGTGLSYKELAYVVSLCGRVSSLSQLRFAPCQDFWNDADEDGLMRFTAGLWTAGERLETLEIPLPLSQTHRQLAKTVEWTLALTSPGLSRSCQGGRLVFKRPPPPQ